MSIAPRERFCCWKLHHHFKLQIQFTSLWRRWNVEEPCIAESTISSESPSDNKGINSPSNTDMDIEKMLFFCLQMQLISTMTCDLFSIRLLSISEYKITSCAASHLPDTLNHFCSPACLWLASNSSQCFLILMVTQESTNNYACVESEDVKPQSLYVHSKHCHCALYFAWHNYLIAYAKCTD